MQNHSIMNHDYYVLKRDATDLQNLKVSPDLIYIDPPFGLNKMFSMTENDGEIKEFSDHWKSENEYIEWYAGIIENCFAKLNKNGWLYCHNNHISNALVLSKIKIRNQYYTNISWRRSHPHNNVKSGWGNIVDSILVFKKGSPYFKVEYSILDEKYEQNSFKNVDERGNYALGPITGEKSRIGYKFEYKGYNPVYGWRKKKDEIVAMDRDGLIHFGKNKPYKKIYSSESKGVPVQNFWNDIHPITRREGRIYPTQKPIALLKRIVATSCPPGGIVFDPFCGAGTTLSAVIQLGENRKCITSDLNEDALSQVCRKYPLFSIDRDGKNIWNNVTL